MSLIDFINATKENRNPINTGSLTEIIKNYTGECRNVNIELQTMSKKLRNSNLEITEMKNQIREKYNQLHCAERTITELTVLNKNLQQQVIQKMDVIQSK